MTAMELTLFLWKTLWLLPQMIFAIDQEQYIRDRLDPKWSEYVEGIAGQYSEYLPPPTESKKFHTATVTNGWSTVSVGEAPYLSVIYSQQAHHHPETLDFYKAGSACGAALVAEDKVITLCACVASWWMFYSSGIWDINQSHYRLSDVNIKSKYLQVAHSKVTFNPTSHTAWVVGDRQTIEKQPKCTTMILDKRNPVEQHEILVVLLLHDIITDPFPGQYIPWPPTPIFHDGPRDTPADLLTFAMQSTTWPPEHYYTDYGEIMLNITAVNFKMKKVNVEDCANEFGQMRREFQERATCFHPAIPEHELCGGLVGSPVLSGETIIGLLAFEVNCRLEKGPAVVLDFVKPVRELIENFTGSTLLNKQNTESPLLWREDEVPKGFVVYEDKIQTRLASRLSLSVISTPSPGLIIILIGVSHFSTTVKTRRIFPKIL